jgi:hypothetical protein
MGIRAIDLMWPYGAGSSKPVSQMEVVVDLDDGSRWVSSFFDTKRYNQGVKGFRGLGPDQPFRFGRRLVIVDKLDEATVRAAVVALIESGDFDEAFESIGPSPGEDGAEG